MEVALALIVVVGFGWVAALIGLAFATETRSYDAWLSKRRHGIANNVGPHRHS